MRRVKQLGFLVVSKNKPRPKRKIEDININTFLKRLKGYKYALKLKGTDKEEIFLQLESIHTLNQSVDYQLVGNALRIVFEYQRGKVGRNWNIQHLGFGSYQRAKSSYLFIFDHMKNETYVFTAYKQRIETELDIWEMSDLNYWG